MPAALKKEKQSQNSGRKIQNRFLLNCGDQSSSRLDLLGLSLTCRREFSETASGSGLK
jgi:hypothetical protein